MKQKWPTRGQRGCIILAARGVPTASERGDKPHVAPKLARWLHNPYSLGVRAEGKIRSGTQVGKVACGPLLLQTPALTRWEHPGRQGLCSLLAHLWATSDFAPRSERTGTPRAAGVM